MISFTHRTHPRSRSIKITVKPSGEILVTTPKRTPQRLIAQFVEEKQNWITAMQQRYSQRQSFGITDKTVAIFGEKLRKKITLGTTVPTEISQGDQRLYLSLTTTHTDETTPQVQDQISKQIDRYLKSVAERYIRPRTQQLADTMNITFGQLTLRKQTTRWGSCSSKGNLNFNWKLVHCPTEVIDYVIIHELAHRRHLNHSAAFWQLVERYDPEYRLHRGWLKRNGMALT